MLNIVIPMAGAGSRFATAGYKTPKPLIPINGVPMIKVVIDNIKLNNNCHFIFICQKDHVIAYNLRKLLNEFAPGCDIIELKGLTEGAACTVLSAEHLINNQNPLMIANSDQYIDADIHSYFSYMDQNKLDGLIMTMNANDPKWSFVEFGSNGFVKRVVEKEVISNEATVGIYNFKHGSSFIAAAKEMIAKNDRVNNEFYVAPTYNYLISEGHSVGIFNIGSEANGMYGLGTPADLEKFLNLPVSSKIKNN